MSDHTEETNTIDQQRPKQLHFGLVLLISFALFHTPYVIDQTISWTNHFQGFLKGVFHAMLFGIAWCMWLLPWSLLIFLLYRWRKWRRFRTHWLLAPLVLVWIAWIISFITHPPTASNRFKTFAKAELPKNIEGLHYHFTGGGVSDYDDTYYFKTTPEEVDRLIREIDLRLDERWPREEHSYTPIAPLPGCPDFSTWTEAKQYRKSNDETGWFYYLITDATKTQVYMLIGCI